MYRDIVGDTLAFLVVNGSKHKPWAMKLFYPYALFFAIACLVSALSLLSKSVYLPAHPNPLSPCTCNLVHCLPVHVRSVPN